MDSLVSKQAAIEAVHKDYDVILDFKSDGHTVADSFEDIINALPPAYPQKGKWIKDTKRFGDDNYHCSICNAVLEKDDVKWRNNYFCYHCGADMREGEKE